MLQLLAHSRSGDCFFTTPDGVNINIHRGADADQRPANWDVVTLAYINHDFEYPDDGFTSFRTLEEVLDYMDIVSQRYDDIISDTRTEAAL